MIAVFGPTAGAKDLMASSRSNALQLSSTTSNFSASLSACTVGGFFSVTVAGRALDDEAGGREFGGALRPNQECHIVSGLQQPAAEISADGSGADHENAHC